MKTSEFTVIFLIILGITAVFSAPPENIEPVADRKVAGINVPEGKDYRKILEPRVPRYELNLATGLNCSSEGNVSDTKEQHVQRPRKTLIQKSPELEESNARRTLLLLKSPELAEKHRERYKKYNARRKALMLKSAELAKKHRERYKKYNTRRKALMLKSAELAKKHREQRKKYNARRKLLLLKSPELAEKHREQYRKNYARRKALMLKSPELVEKRREQHKKYNAHRKALMLKSPELAEKYRERRREYYRRRKALTLESRQLTENKQNGRIKVEDSEVEVGPLAEEHWYKQLKMQYPELAANVTQVKEEPWINLEGEEGAQSEVAEDQWHNQIKLSSPTGITVDEWNKPIKPEYSEEVEEQSVLNEKKYKTVSEKCVKVVKVGESSGQIIVQPSLMEINNDTYKIATLKVEPV